MPTKTAIVKPAFTKTNSTPHSTLNSSRGIIRYRDEDLDDRSDEEIWGELAPQGVIHVKRFISKRNGQAVKLNTFLITFNFPTILSSIRMGLYNDKISPYVPNLIRCIKCQIFGHGKGQCNGKLKCFKCSEEDQSEVLQLWSTSHGFIERLSIFPERKRDPKS